MHYGPALCPLVYQWVAITCKPGDVPVILGVPDAREPLGYPVASTTASNVVSSEVRLVRWSNQSLGCATIAKGIERFEVIDSIRISLGGSDT